MADPEAGERRREFVNAVDLAAEAEWEYSTSAEHATTLREKYRMAMEACAATGDVPRTNVCWYAKRAVERRMWELYGRPNGLDRSEFTIPHTTWYEVGRELGYTDPSYDPRGKDRAAEPQPKKPSPRQPRADRPDFGEQNRRYIQAFHNAGDALHVVSEWLQRFPVEGNVDGDIAETTAAILEAYAKNVHDMANSHRIVPTNAQPMLIDASYAALATDKMMRMYLTRVVKLETFRAKSEGGGKFLTPSEIAKYVKRAPRDLHVSLEPAGTFEAQWMGFHGQKCAGCGSWRMLATDASPDRLRCVRCGDEAAREPFVFCRECHYRTAPGADTCPQCGAGGSALPPVGNTNMAPTLEGGA